MSKKKKQEELTEEERLHQLFDEKINPILLKKISQGIIDGVSLAFDSLYDEFVEPHDVETDDGKKAEIVEKLLSRIRLAKLKSLQKEGIIHEKED